MLPLSSDLCLKSKVMLQTFQISKVYVKFPYIFGNSLFTYMCVHKYLQSIRNRGGKEAHGLLGRAILVRDINSIIRLVKYSVSYHVPEVEPSGEE